MASKEFHPEDLQLAIQDHEMVSLLLGNAAKMLVGEPTTDTRMGLEVTMLLIHKKLFDHFAYEEQHIFPPVLTARPTKDVSLLVGELHNEHQMLLKRIRQAREVVSQHDFPIGAGAAWKVLMSLLVDLEEHARSEDGLFLSLLDKETRPRARKVT